MANTTNDTSGNPVHTTDGTADTTVHIVMFPFLAFGHISPFAQLAHKLSNAGVESNARITFLSAAANVARVATLLPPTVSIVPLHLPSVPGLPAGAESTAELTLDGAELLKIAIDGTKPQVAALLAELRPNVIMVDFSTPWIPSVASPLGIKTVHFSVFAALSGAYLMVPARRLHGPNPKLEDLESPPAGFPASSALARGVPGYQAADFLYVFKSFHGQPCVYDRVVECIDSCDAVVMKTCPEMEGHYIDYYASQYQKKVLLLGPNVPDPPKGGLEPKWAQWLANFDDGTVIFASFGSETFLTRDAAQELLLGLETTGLPFIVVLNFPKSDNGEAMEDIKKEHMPAGFEERVKGRGVVHSGWVQQQHLLRHPAVGCYMNHAGFSSLVEALIAGCRLVMMPQKGDQFLNSTLFARELGLGVEVERAEEDGRFTREAVRDAVSAAMDEEDAAGKERRRKWREFLMDEALHQRFTVEFVKNLKELVGM